MTWYRAGTASVTNGSTAVVGAGTTWTTAAATGAGFVGPDGRIYEVAGAPSDTSLTLATPYLGATANAQPYALLPTQSYMSDLSLAASALVGSFAAVRDGAGQGLFAAGSAAVPGVRCSGDADTGLVWLGSNVLGLATSGAIRLTIDAVGNLGVGTSPGAPIHVNRLAAGADQVILALQNPSAAAGTAVTMDLNPTTAPMGVRSAQIGAVEGPGVNQVSLVFRSANADVPTGRWKVNYDGQLMPFLDNTYDLGSGAYRVRVVYAGSGSINTSDEREKAWRGGLGADELAAAKEIAGAIGVFQFNDAVADKGADKARLHVGVKAQQVVSIMQAHGLDAMRYGFVCYDAWDATPGTPAQPARAAVVAEDGTIVSPEQPAFAGTPAQPAGDRYGVRYDELAMFVAAAQEQRLAALEARATS